jgi:hypothetical protein
LYFDKESANRRGVQVRGFEFGFGVRLSIVVDIPFYVSFFLWNGKPNPEGKTKHEGGDEEAVRSRLS